jgi:signal peptidase I
MISRTIFLIVFFFTLGFVTANVLSTGAFFANAQAPERISPSDVVSEDQIHVFNDEILINVSGAEWARFEDSNSMDPILDVGANALQIKPTSEEQINVGDIVSYRRADSKERIIHRVIFKGVDEKGTYFVLKGDNNPVSDPGKVRFEDIDRVLFAIIY